MVLRDEVEGVTVEFEVNTALSLIGTGPAGPIGKSA
jgi:hypothetical protein